MCVYFVDGSFDLVKCIKPVSLAGVSNIPVKCKSLVSVRAASCVLCGEAIKGEILTWPVINTTNEGM